MTTPSRPAPSTAPATVPAEPPAVHPAKYARQRVELQMPRFASVLPKGLDSERFTNLAVRAVQATPDLIECFATGDGELSFMLAALQAAAVGLEPNTPLQHCYILPRRNKGTMTAQFSMDYRGFMELARRSGQVKTIFAEVVYAGDHFTYERGLEGDLLEHRPCPSDQRGELTHAYAVVRYKDGGYSLVVLDRAEIEGKHRARSDSWKGSRPEFSPWTTDPEAMWRKTAIRQLAKWMPLSADAAVALDSDDARLALVDDGDIPEIVAQHDAIDVGEATIPEGAA
jgi:recombination protein RecT